MFHVHYHQLVWFNVMGEHTRTTMNLGEENKEHMSKPKAKNIVFVFYQKYHQQLYIQGSD